MGGLVLPLLLLTTALSAPVALADSGSCTSCGSQGPCPTEDNITVTTENLEGFEELRAVIGAWTNEDTRLLMKELIWKDHCTPRLPKSEAQEITVYKDGEEISQSAVVEIPFKAHRNDVEAKITYSDNGTSERVYATVAGTASVLEEPMEILKENAKYQAIIENLEEQGYTVKEDNAKVVKTYLPVDYAAVPSCIEGKVWNTAKIYIEAVRGDQTKDITAFVCIDKNKVLNVEDGAWDCISCWASLGGCALCVPLCTTIVACLPCLAVNCVGVFISCCACTGCPSPCDPDMCQ